MSEIRPGDIAALDQALAHADAALAEWVERYRELIREIGEVRATGQMAMELAEARGASLSGATGLLAAAIRRIVREEGRREKEAG